MKYTITIEETVAKDFEIEAESAEEAYKMTEQKYKSGEFVLDPGECQFRQITITNPSSESTEWREFWSKQRDCNKFVENMAWYVPFSRGSDHVLRCSYDIIVGKLLSF